jgi:hypothetical protein
MSLKKRTKQYMIGIIALMIGGGFAFGTMANMGSTIGGGQQNNNNQNQFDATLPNSTYTTASFDLTMQEQQILAYQNDVVFVNAFYGTTEGKDQLKSLEGLDQDFNGRLYVSNVNYSQSNFQSYGFTNLPQAVVVGGTPVDQSRTMTVILQNVTRNDVARTSCNVMRNWNSLGAYCQSQ